VELQCRQRIEHGRGLGTGCPIYPAAEWNIKSMMTLILKEIKPIPMRYFQSTPNPTSIYAIITYC